MMSCYSGYLDFLLKLEDKHSPAAPVFFNNKFPYTYHTKIFLNGT